MKIGIVVARFNEEITGPMLDKAKEHIIKNKGEVKDIMWVPGSFEIPFAANQLLQRSDIDAVVTLGAIIEGNTDHDGVIAYTMASKISDLGMKYNKPISLGVSGPKMTYKDAVARIDEYAKRAVDCVFDLKK